ncbi:MAG: class I SAM-dependent methyltransferase, partial [Acidimicrobiales bacterium]
MPRPRLRDWRVKAGLQRTFSAVPGGTRLNWVFQRHVTHTYPASDAKLAEDAELARHHVATYQRHGRAPLAEARFYEFGAGWDLAIPLLLHGLGVDHQVVIDLRPLAREDLVFDLAHRLTEGLHGLRRPLPTPSGSLDAYLRRLGIHYVAPADARRTSFAGGSIDCITSTNTLEHIPRDDLASILRECRRILADDGCCSFQVDYKDHYSYFDDTITPFNFLRFGESEWLRYNPALHYQNRLRHADYLARYDEAELAVADVDLTREPADLAVIASLPLAAPFRDRPFDELAVRASRVALRPTERPR